MFETQAWRTGEAGAEQVKAWIRVQGYHTISLDRIQEDGAPSLILETGRRVILSDVLVAKHGIMRGVDVKTKSTATFHERSRTWEHGISTRHFEHYLQLGRTLGIEIWLAIFEPQRSLVLMADVEELQLVRRNYDGPNMSDGQPHVFFPLSHFQQYYGPANTIPPQTAAPRSVRHGQAPASTGPKQGSLLRFFGGE